jgi:hypothetical protein
MCSIQIGKVCYDLYPRQYYIFLWNRTYFSSRIVKVKLVSSGNPTNVVESTKAVLIAAKNLLNKQPTFTGNNVVSAEEVEFTPSYNVR